MIVNARAVTAIERFLVVASAYLLGLAAGQSAWLEYAGGKVSENFDALGTNVARLTNDATLPGWYVYMGSLHLTPLSGVGVANRAWYSVTGLGPSDGYGTSFGGFFNMGEEGGTNRALGMKPFDWDCVVALVLRNATDQTFSHFTLGYFCEQWISYGWGKLDFEYGVFENFDPGVGNDPSGSNPNTIIPHPPDGERLAEFHNGFRDPRNGRLDCRLPLPSWQWFEPFHGHAFTNRYRVSSTEPTCWHPGQYLVLRWFYDEVERYNHTIMTIDDVEFSASARRGFEFCDVSVLTDGLVELCLCGDAGDRYTVESSTNLVDWSFVREGTNGTGSMVTLVELVSADAQTRYYRARKDE